MRTTLHLLGILFIVFLSIMGCGEHINTEYGAFEATISNRGTTAITDIELSIVGADEVVTIDTIAPGQSSDKRIFILPVFEGERPESWGDYCGVYTQNGVIKDISILNYEHNFNPEVTLKINNQSYVAIYP